VRQFLEVKQFDEDGNNVFNGDRKWRIETLRHISRTTALLNGLSDT